jgi:DNA-binding MarR family transcriptional regulator/ribosomal protein S18 acetylase RimI-like enzyme
VPPALDQRVAAVRRFSRFYTRRIGLLDEAPYDCSLSLAEARVVYELAQRDRPTASALGKDLGIDAGYLSRILRGFRERGLVESRPAPNDARHRLLALTKKGRRTYERIDARSRADIDSLISHLVAADQRRLIAAMDAIEALLEPRDATPGAKKIQAAARDIGAAVLRPPRPGDYGWVVRAHGALYAREHGYDERFEALVARIVADFVQNFDPKGERCWIADRAGEPVGSVFLVRRSKTVAKLRLLIVDPSARGLGLGRRLVAECIRFAREAGYRRITLWTQNDLAAARGIYKAAGFRVVGEEAHRSFGKRLVAETWELAL